MICFNKDIVFLYHIDLRYPPIYGKIRLSALPDNCENLIDEIKPIIIDVINNSNSKKTWSVDYEDIYVSILSIIDRDQVCVNISDDNDTTDMYIYTVFIDVRDHNNLNYRYKAKNVIIDNTFYTF
jgi:hypothetical protein